MYKEEEKKQKVQPKKVQTKKVKAPPANSENAAVTWTVPLDNLVAKTLKPVAAAAA